MPRMTENEREQKTINMLDTADVFRKVYADAVIPDMTDEQWEVASKARQLSWRGDRMPLTQAIELYAAIVDGYNEFKPDMLAQLQAFIDNGIEVTPARENSVCVYLWIPEILVPDILEWIGNHWNADEVDMQKDGSLRIWWD